MSETARVSISLPSDVLRAVEARRQERQETRSDFIRRAVEMLLRRDEDLDAEARYVRGYQECPEDDDEMAQAYAAAGRLAEEPWE